MRFKPFFIVAGLLVFGIALAMIVRFGCSGGWPPPGVRMFTKSEATSVRISFERHNRHGHRARLFVEMDTGELDAAVVEWYELKPTLFGKKEAKSWAPINRQIFNETAQIVFPIDEKIKCIVVLIARADQNVDDLDLLDWRVWKISKDDFATPERPYVELPDIAELKKVDEVFNADEIARKLKAAGEFRKKLQNR